MTLDKLRLLKVRVMLESKHKQQMRRENKRLFVPSEYYLYGVTKRDLFKRELKREIRELGGKCKWK